jgi:hypothetical protein
VNGTVGSDLRAGAQSIVLGENGQVTRGALLGAYSIETKPNSSIGNDVLFGAFQGLLDGTIGKDVIAGANGIEIRGTVGRNVRVSVGNESSTSFSPMRFMPNAPTNLPIVPPGLTIAPTAKIGGDLIYESEIPAEVDTGAQVTGPVVQQTPVPGTREGNVTVTAEVQQAQEQQNWVEYGFNQLRRFIVLLVLGVLALWIAPRFIEALATFVRTNPLGSFGRGFLMVIGFIVACIAIIFLAIVFAIVFGLLTLGDLAGLTLTTGIVTLGVLAFAYGVFTSYVAPIVVSFLLGRAIMGRMQVQNRFVAFVVGLILVSLVLLIPILGVIVGILIALVALGALALWLAPRLSRAPASAVQPV